jgi:hypothetical protein
VTLKHIEDDSDLSVLVNDHGSVLLVCGNGHQWVGTGFMPVSSRQSELARRDLAQSIRIRSVGTLLVPGMDLDILER